LILPADCHFAYPSVLQNSEGKQGIGIKKKSRSCEMMDGEEIIVKGDQA